MANNNQYDSNKIRTLNASGRNKKNEDLSHFVYGKLPPQAIPLEEAILGAIMLDKDALPVVLDILRPESFYKDGHQKIYRAMMSLFEKSQPIDLLTVSEALRKQGDIEMVGGSYYLVELTNRVASAANIEYHARIVAQKHIQRELIRVSTNTIKNAYEDTTDVFELLDDAEQGLFDITQNNLSRSYESMGSLASKLIKSLEELRQKENGLTGVPTGFTEIDRLTSGFQKSDLIIIAARPGMGKCLGKGTKVLMYDGTLRKVEDIQVGELLMGVDSKPRSVRSLANGKEQMYWVRQNKGIDYKVNESHILSLKRSRNERKHKQSDVLNINVLDYCNASPEFRSKHKGYKVAVNFPAQKVNLSPYYLGLWLGNDLRAKNETTDREEAILEYLQSDAKEADLQSKKYSTNSKEYSAHQINEEGKHQGISTREALAQLNVLNNKYIPQAYLINSEENRLDLLAGLIDSSGHYSMDVDSYNITQRKQELAVQIKFLCDTLGFRTLMEVKKETIENESCETTIYNLKIHGDIDKIPIKVKRKQTSVQKNPADWQVTDIKIEKDIVDDYYGFELSGDGLFLLEDMTVTHNTSYVLSLARNASTTFEKPVAIFSLEMSNLQLVQRLVSLEAEISGHKLRTGQLEDYEWEQLNSAIEHMSEVPIFIDDTPGINIFELRAKCRRLKMQHDIQMIIIDYLQLMSGGGDNQRGNREQEVSMISRSLKALAKELDVPVIALSQLSRAVEVRGGTKRPQLSDLRESGSIEQDADQVAFIYRPEYYQIMEDENGDSLKGVAEIIFAKNRHGATKTIKLKFVEQFAKFTDLDDFSLDDLSGFGDDNGDPNIIKLPSRMNKIDDIPF